jgi:hypothetical protein
LCGGRDAARRSLFLSHERRLGDPGCGDEETTAMIKQKISFKNSQGESLAGLLELPDKPVAYALLAHCFT